jgi:DNA-binding MarR family transcriptional regulator
LTVPHAPTLPPPLIGVLLRLPWEHLREHMLAGVHERGFTDLVQAHLNVMVYPGPDDVRPSELATRARMSKQAMNYLLGQLEQLGYLTREDDPEDQRFKRVRLTERGHAAGQAVRETVLEIEAEWDQQLGPGRLEQLRAILSDLSRDALPRPPHPRSGS